MKTILLIEDNTDVLDNLTEYLQLNGYKILSASDGKQGMELAKACLPDLIICDVLMPRIGGYEVLQLLSNAKETADIPFVFSTSNSEKVDREQALKLGADDYIVKPFEVEELQKLIKTWI